VPINRVLSYFENYSEVDRFGIFRILFRRLRPDDQIRAFFAFIRV